jgi:hypothetical protein
MESKDGNDPTVDALTGGYIRVRQHPFDIPGMNFYYQIPNSNEIEAK